MIDQDQIDTMVRSVAKRLQGASEDQLRLTRKDARTVLGRAANNDRKLSDLAATYLRLEAEFCCRQLGDME